MPPRAQSPQIVRGKNQGSDLVIVLFFVILLTVVTIAFLSRSLTAVKVSASSAGETKASVLAASAGNIIVGDLKQEIAAGSTTPTLTPTSTGWTVYTPNSNQTMLPFQNGIPASSSTIPNLITRSVSKSNTGTNPYVAYKTTAGFYSTTTVPPARAAQDASAASATFSTTAPYTTSLVNSNRPSLNGRYVSPAQWNAHYLIPRPAAVMGTASQDSTPITNFVPPDWVVVTRSGTNTSAGAAITWISGSGGINDSTMTNKNYAIGRYAYAIYNEGGLLDMNAAGYPTGLTAAQISKKGSLALADLTQLTAGATTLTQAQVDNIVGWRNYASAQLSGGSYGNFTPGFNSTTASNWLTNFVLGNGFYTNGYMKVLTPPGVTTPPTDQAFLSRQQLMSLVQSLSISPDFLQYMGTFSRALEQPSTVPSNSSGGPKILTGGAPPAPTSADSYVGNNDNATNDPTVNPSFLTVRVASPGGWTRLNGTTAVTGEPLVKTKFALSWLAMVAYNAYDASSSNMSLPAGFAATASDPEPIYDRFGLRRSSTTSPWVYNHGQNTIMSLSQVAALTGANAREPDFAELLKAAIVAGSLGKGGPNIHNNQENYQYSVDVQLDFQVLQIMANLIDQQDTDSYPTAIQINNAIQGTVTAYGVEDLPYFYRFQLFSVVDRLPKPTISSKTTTPFAAIPAGTTTTATTSMATTYPAGTLTSATWTCNNIYSASATGCQSIATAGTLTDQGDATFFYVPDLWNPHDPNTISTETSSLRPSRFRIYGATIDPSQALLTPWKIGVESAISGSGNTAANPTATPTPIPGSSSVTTVLPENDGANPPATYYWPISASSTWPVVTGSTSPAANVTLAFSDGGGTLFREPTLLWNNNPTGLNISGTAITDANTSQTYYGIIAGQTPISTQVTYSSKLNSTGAPTVGPYDGTYIFQGGQLNLLSLQPASYGNGVFYQQISFFLQYQDASGNWITYDVKYPEYQHSGMTSSTPIVNTADFTNWQCPLKNNQISNSATVMDPRTPRWGMGTNSTLGNNGQATGGDYLQEPLPNSDFATPSSMKNIYFNVVEDNRPRMDVGNYVYYSNPCMTSDPNPPTNTMGNRNLPMRWLAAGQYRAGSSGASPYDFDGLFSQNNPVIKSSVLSQDNTTPDPVYNEDPDGVARPAMGAYADTTLGTGVGATTIGLPMATASTFNNNGVATATSQSQSRPLILNRPFRSVAEMSYAFRGSPWKNIDFFTPASGDSALLDTFCVNEPPTNAMVAGKVDLNTRQIPVLQAIVAGACRDELNNVTTPPGYALPPLNGTEAKAVATTLTTITSDTGTHAWRGPLTNISGLVGRYVSTTPPAGSDTDVYTYTPVTPLGSSELSTMSYAGLSAALDCSKWNGSSSGNHVFSTAPTAAAQTATPLIQRMRESAIRPLADAGQVRVWNLLIDIVAQSGRYPKTATGFDQFLVDGQTHIWLHVAIDRFTGQVLDKQVEVVTP